jgi:hypothetical protein
MKTFCLYIQSRSDLGDDVYIYIYIYKTTQKKLATKIIALKISKITFCYLVETVD